MALWAVAKLMTNGKLVAYRFVDTQDDKEYTVSIEEIKEFINKQQDGVKNLGFSEIAGGSSLMSKGKIPLVGVSDQFGRRFEAVMGVVQDIILEKIGYNLYKVANYTGKVTEESGNSLIFRNDEIGNASFYTSGDETEIKCEEGIDIDGIDNIKFKARDIAKVQQRSIAKADMLGASITIGKDGGVVIKAIIGDVASIPDGCTVIKTNTFHGSNENCATVKRVVCPKTLKTIDSSAFTNMDFLETIELNDGLEVIGSQILVGCKKVKELRIPRTVEKIHRQAFQNSGVRKLYLYRVTVAKNQWLLTDSRVAISIVG